MPCEPGFSLNSGFSLQFWCCLVQDLSCMLVPYTHSFPVTHSRTASLYTHRNSFIGNFKKKSLLLSRLGKIIDGIHCFSVIDNSPFRHPYK